MRSPYLRVIRFQGQNIVKKKRVRLIQWSGQIHTEFHVHRVTWDTLRGLLVFADPAVTVSGRFFHIVLLTLSLPYQGPTTPIR
jgi:hypothetical protein